LEFKFQSYLEGNMDLLAGATIEEIISVEAKNKILAMFPNAVTKKAYLLDNGYRIVESNANYPTSTLLSDKFSHSIDTAWIDSWYYIQEKIVERLSI